MAKEAFTFRCSSCGALLAGKLPWVGRSVRCHKCNAVIMVPQPPAEEPVAEPTSVSMQPNAGDTAVHVVQQPRREPTGIEIEDLFATVGRWIGEGFRIAAESFAPIYATFLMLIVLHVELVVVGGIALALVSGVVTGGFVLPWTLVFPALIGGLVVLMIDATRSRAITPWQLFSCFVNGTYWRTVAAFWLWFAAMMAVWIPAAGVSAGLFYMMLPWGKAGIVIGSIISGIAALLLLYFVSRIIFVLPLVIDQGTAIAESFRRSWRITERIAEGWGVFVLLVALKVMGAVLAAVAALPAGGIAYAIFRNTGDYVRSYAVGGAIFALLLPIMYTLVIPPLFVAYRESVPH